MWRWIGTIPRVVRQHVYNYCPHASTGINVEEKHKPCSENGEVKTEEQSQQGAVCTYSPPNRQDNAGYDGNNEKQRKTPHYDFWTLLHKPHSLLEAVGWGAAVILGIQLTRPGLFRGDHRFPADGRRKRRCFFYQVAFALPDKYLTQTKCSVLDKDKTPQADHEPTQPEENDPLSKVMHEFEHICNKYTAMGRNLLGLQQAEKGNLVGAAHKWREASDLGYAKAQFNMGLCYETGQGVKRNLSEAVKYYSLAAEEGHPQALYNLALLHLQGKGGVEKDPKLAVNLLEQSADQGLMEAQTYLGVYYSEDETKDMEKAVNFFRAAAQQNDPEAQFFLAICYEQGWGVEVNECKAADLYTQAAQADHDGALYNLGIFHEYGLGGLPEDRVSASELYQKAASLGHENAQLKLEGMQARSAAAEWTEEIQTNKSNSASKPVATKKINHGRLGSSSSSPTLTDYLREHLSELAIGTARVHPTKISQFQMWLRQQEVTSPTSSRSSGDSGVIFSLGADEDDIDTLNDLEQERDQLVHPVSPLVSHHHCSMLHKNSTMPDFNVVACT